LFAVSGNANYTLMCVVLFSYLQESENPEKATVLAEQVDEYVDIKDEMPTATYQSVEIEKGAEVMSVSGGSGSDSPSLQCFSFGFVYRFGVRELRG
jgi:hypothetical protein